MYNSPGLVAIGGYASGVSDHRRTVVLAPVTALAYSVVLLLVVVALDRPLQLSAVTESAMLDRQESLMRSGGVEP